MKIKRLGYVILLIAILSVSLTPIAYKFGSNSNPLMLSFFVSLVGVIGSAILMFAKGTHKNLVEHARNRKSLLPFAFVGVALGVQILIFSYTTHYITASLMAVLYRSWPLMFILIAPFMLRERVTKYGALAVVLGFLGLAVALLGGTSLSIPLLEIPFVGLVLVAAFLDALAGTFQRRYKYELTSTLFLYNLFMLVAILAFVLIIGVPGPIRFTMNDVYVILFLGVVQNILATIFFTSAFRMVDISIISNTTMTVPFITIVLSYFLLGEAIEPVYLIIAFSVLAGLLIQKFAPKSSNYVPKSGVKSYIPALFDVTGAFVNTKSRVIYDHIKDNGRALAFCKKIDDGETLGQYAAAMEELRDKYYCLITTNKLENKEIQPEEFEFIKDIMGYEDKDVLVLGIGKPDDVEAAFSELHERARAGDYSAGAPPKVVS